MFPDKARRLTRLVFFNAKQCPYGRRRGRRGFRRSAPAIGFRGALARRCFQVFRVAIIGSAQLIEDRIDTRLAFFVVVAFDEVDCSIRRIRVGRCDRFRTPFPRPLEPTTASPQFLCRNPGAPLRSVPLGIHGTNACIKSCAERRAAECALIFDSAVLTVR
jgi:hypothetical protein